MIVVFLINVKVEKHPGASQRLNVEAAGNLAKLMSKYHEFIKYFCIVIFLRNIICYLISYELDLYMLC